MKRLNLLCVLVASFVIGCDGDPTEAPLPSSPPAEATPAIVDGGHGGNPHFWWLVPQWHYSSFPGTADTGMNPTVVVRSCPDWTEEDQTCSGAEVASLSKAAGTIVIGLEEDYNAFWSTGAADPQYLEVFRADVYLGDPADGLLVGTRDVIFVRSQREANDIGLTNELYAPARLNHDYVFRFRLEEGVALEAVGFTCPEGSDCTVFEETYTFEEDGTVDTREDTDAEETAFTVDWADVQIEGEPAGSDDSFTLVFSVRELVDGQCVVGYPLPQSGTCVDYATIPEDVTFFEDGDPEFPAGVVAACPDANVTDAYDLAKADDGVVSFPPAGPSLLTCAQQSAMDRLPSVLRRLAGLVLPRPLYAEDEGETGLVGGFSTIFWAVPGVEIQASGTVPTGPFEAGQTIPLQFEVTSTNPHHPGTPIDGVQVNFSVTGGTASPTSAISANGGLVDVSWTLPQSAGTHTLTAATVTQASADFSATVPATAEIIAINDASIFDETRITGSNNQTLVKNLVNFTGTGARTATAVFDFGRNSGCSTFDGSTTQGCPSATVKTLIEAEDLTVTTIESSETDGLDDDIPADAKVLFLWQPRLQYTVAEVNALKQFAAEGGRIVFVAEHESFYGASGLDTQNQMFEDMGSSALNIGGLTSTVSTIGAHQVTTGLTGIAVAAASVLSSAGTGGTALVGSSADIDTVRGSCSGGDCLIAAAVLVDTTPTSSLVAARVDAAPQKMAETTMAPAYDAEGNPMK